MISRMRKCVLLVGVALLALAQSVPAQTGVTAVLPNGRVIHPAGNWIALAPYPFALAVRPDGAEIAAPSIGFPFALNVIANPADPQPSVRRMPAGENSDPAIEVHAGLAYSADGSLLYVATGDSGKIRTYKTSDWTKAAEVSLDGPIPNFSKPAEGSFAATVLASPDGKTLFALDQGNWRIVVHRQLSLRPRALSRWRAPLRHEHRALRIHHHSWRQRKKSTWHWPSLSTIRLSVQSRARRRHRRRQKDSRPRR